MYVTQDTVGVIISIVVAATGVFGGLYLMMRNLKSDLKADFNELRGEFKELGGEFKELRGEVIDLKVGVAELKVGLSAVNHRIDATNERIARLENPKQHLQLHR